MEKNEKINKGIKLANYLMYISIAVLVLSTIVTIMYIGEGLGYAIGKSISVAFIGWVFNLVLLIMIIKEKKNIGDVSGYTLLLVGSIISLFSQGLIPIIIAIIAKGKFKKELNSTNA